MLQGREDGYELLKSKLIYATSDVNTDELYLVEKGIYDEQIRIEELADLAIQSKFNKDKYTEAIADCSQRIKDLMERRDMLAMHIKCNEKAREEIERTENYTKQMKPVMTEFDGYYSPNCEFNSGDKRSQFKNIYKGWGRDLRASVSACRGVGIKIS